jgi:hypothetical protein
MQAGGVKLGILGIALAWQLATLNKISPLMAYTCTLYKYTVFVLINAPPQ